MQAGRTDRTEGVEGRDEIVVMEGLISRRRRSARRAGVGS